ncbi:MAG: MarR family transcriptional regulator, partial [Leptolyngbyaceae bacterium]|nr:MarR family transcriptional regulator [Leptolyngbyaceae bacterium]
MSTPYSPEMAAKEPCLGAVRELVRAYQSFSSYSEAFVRQYDLTPAQFDVIATLGNTTGMSMGDIGEKTLITKGTLTGVVDRLEKKGLIVREVPPENRRSVVVRLTAEGDELFQQVFPAHIADMSNRFE